MIKESVERLGDRHLRQDRGDRLLPAQPKTFSPRLVRLTATLEAANSKAGQHTLWMGVNLLARQFAVLGELEIVVPAVPLLPGVALFGKADDLSSTLATTARLVAGDAIGVSIPETPRPVAVEVVVGCGSGFGNSAEERIQVAGSGWSFWAGDAVPPGVHAVDDANPIGPYYAACIAAGEVFKSLRGMRPGKGEFIDSLAMSLWDFEQNAPCEAVSTGTSPCGLEIPPFYLIGAGAVGQSVAAVLSAARVRCHATVIDRRGETIDETNLNRYPLATLQHIDQAKEVLTADFLRQAGIAVYVSDQGWPAYAYENPHLEQREDLRLLEEEYKYELVLSCVDKNSSRHAIQSFWPRYIIGGSTDDLLVQVSAYDMTSPYECLKCSNPLEVGGSTIEEIADELRRLSPTERREVIRARGGDADAIEAFLSSPKCGMLGEQELSKFASDPDQVDWSVGFVSVATGVLQAAQLVKYALGGPELAFPRGTGNTFRFSFLRPKPRRSIHLRRSGCECDSTGRVVFRDYWGTRS